MRGLASRHFSTSRKLLSAAQVDMVDDYNRRRGVARNQCIGKNTTPHSRSFLEPEGSWQCCHNKPTSKCPVSNAKSVSLLRPIFRSVIRKRDRERTPDSDRPIGHRFPGKVMMANTSSNEAGSSLGRPKAQTGPTCTPKTGMKRECMVTMSAFLRAGIARKSAPKLALHPAGLEPSTL
jgi:hypothetical protein